MKEKIKDFLRTLFRYLYFRMIRVFDIILNSHKPDFPLEKVKTILLVEVQDMGDTIIASPCMRQIRKLFPDAVIHVIVQKKSLELVRHNPNITDAFGVTDITSYAKLFRVALEYRKKHYDLVICLSPSVRNNLIATLSGANIISGYLNDFEFASTNAHDQPVEVRGFDGDGKYIWHVDEPLIVRALKPAAPFGADTSDYVDTELKLPDETMRFAEDFFQRHDIKPDDFLVALHPVCLNAYRNWPAEKFAELSDELVEKYKNIKIYLIGAPADKPTLDYIISQTKHKDRMICDLTTTIDQTAAVIYRCNALVGMDSCPSDISGAFNVPTVHLHGPTSPHVTGPGGRRNYPVVQGVPCSPCGLNVHVCPHENICMKGMELSKVFNATVEAIERNLVEAANV